MSIVIIDDPAVKEAFEKEFDAKVDAMLEATGGIGEGIVYDDAGNIVGELDETDG